MTEQQQKDTCDRLVEMAVESMHEAGAPLGMIVDRLLTYTLAQMCAVDGSPTTAQNMRTMAAKIDDGLFHRITGENVVPVGRRH